MKWSEVQCTEGAEEWDFMGKVYKSNKMVRSEGLGLNPECNMSGKIY
jgi:hypothetical protein